MLTYWANDSSTKTSDTCKTFGKNFFPFPFFLVPSVSATI
ncbi:hypothetical protein LEP1GSC058_1219 [Leptospira fainei serovar Hurstbridge str. BUT 6]|uniref:Uncharacterized protein n=1 Tax=Leptospira fainei serovar Hurstbridge str. BUT 6 TaxID=1193011 RepID=S3VIN2_9LEPT|nr:hypothetical protein LEP1GSC058_1219 [Leptospira fainei serovar Hurstbridge str. BUT 6]